MAEYRFERYTTPVPDALACELISLWDGVFEASFSWLKDILAGREDAANRDFLYVATLAGKVVASCRLTISRDDARLGGLAEVATHPQHRGKQLAQTLCAMAAEEFDRENGQALFLGTVNPVAAKMYARLGWRYLAGTKVMLRTKPPVTPEEFMVDYFRIGADLPVRILPGTAHQRISIIPFILTPHDWIVLDANTGILSTRYFTQTSCEGLYPRYETLRYRGTWFALSRGDGAVVGLASARQNDEGFLTVEALAHPRYQDQWLEPLFQAAVQWARRQGDSLIYTPCARGDCLKPLALEKLGRHKTEQAFQIKGFDEPLDMYGTNQEYV